VELKDILKPGSPVLLWGATRKDKNRLKAAGFVKPKRRTKKRARKR
jgi:hypothetical protein